MTDGRVGLVAQYRYPLEAFTFELPSGAVEDGESPLEAACREVLEEAGLTGGAWDAWVLLDGRAQRACLNSPEEARPNGVQHVARWRWSGVAFKRVISLV